MVAQVAALDPDTAAKMPQPMTLACSSRPGTLLSQGDRPVNMSAVSRERNRISPIHRNSGNAVSDQPLVLPQMVKTMVSPTGRLVKTCMANIATPSRARPIQKPDARTAISSAISRAAVRMSMPAAYSDAADAPAGCLKNGRPRNRATAASAKATARPMQPSAMPICGIHSGVASAPCDMS